MWLSLAFILAGFATFAVHVLCPEVPLMFFSAFLALACLRLPLLKSLWLALAVGLCLDLLSSGTRFGFYLLPNMLTILLLHRFRKHFFEEQIISFSLYSAAISSLTTFWMALFSLVSGPQFLWTWEFCAVDFLLLPAVDGISGYLLLVLPFTIYRLLKRTARLHLGHLRLRKHS